MIEETWVYGWDLALAEIKKMGGLKRFKSVLFSMMFKNPPYPCEFCILHEGRKLLGAFTCEFIAHDDTYGVSNLWYIGDFDTAEGTHGMARELLERFMRKKSNRFYLCCWDNTAARFWYHMGKAYNLSVTEIGKSKYNMPVLQFGPREAHV